MLMKVNQGGIRVFDPRGSVETEVKPIAPRPKALRGLRLAILDNSKWNANKLLRGAAVALSGSIEFAAVNYYVKHSFSKDAFPELIERIAAQNDIVLTAIGDCGSCTSASVRDAIQLESRGLPSAVIITAEFKREMDLTRIALGMPALQPVVIDHPVSSITAAEIAARVGQITKQAQAVWLGAG
jgi:hypothetical protein